MRELEFKRLIEKYQQGLLSGREKRLLDEWFAAMGHDKVHPIWSAEDKLTLKTKILQQIEEEKIKTEAGEESSFISSRRLPVFWRRSRFQATYRIAASLFLLATVSYFVWQFRRTEPGAVQVLQATAVGNVNKVLLSDGSLVWLKGNSMLTYPKEFIGKERHVTLLGEALFEVTKDPSHPFVIQCGELTTTVLGTSFNIKSHEKNIEVVVLTGKVSLTSVSDKQGIVVLPNEKAVYNGLNKQLVKVETVKKEEKIATVASTEYRMDFDDTRMGEIIRRIEGKFNVKVMISDPKLGNCMITADFTDQSLDKTFDMISQALGFEYEIDGNQISLRGTGCDSEGGPEQPKALIQ